MRAEFDDVVVGDQHPALGDDVLAVVGLALQRTGDLGGLDITFENLGERALDEPAEASFEGLQDSHESSLSCAAEADRIWAG